MTPTGEPRPLHVVLVEPEIPQNTGNIARSCLALGATLHLVKPYGFFINDRHLKRAGMDYWHEVDRVEHRDIEHFLSLYGQFPLAFFSRRGERLYTQLPQSEPLFLIFGRESTGLSAKLLERYAADRVYRLPMREGVRSLNLASAVTTALYEASRQRGFAGLV